MARSGLVPCQFTQTILFTETEITDRTGRVDSFYCTLFANGAIEHLSTWCVLIVADPKLGSACSVGKYMMSSLWRLQVCSGALAFLDVSVAGNTAAWAVVCCVVLYSAVLPRHWEYLHT